MDKHTEDRKAVEAFLKSNATKNNKTKTKETTMKTAKAHTEKKIATKKTETKKSDKKIVKAETKKGKGKDKAKGKAGRKQRASKNGKYKSIRNMMEILFAKNKELTKEEADKAVMANFPTSGWAGRIKIGRSHFPSYKTRIVSHCMFKTMAAPAWAKKTSAKVK